MSRNLFDLDNARYLNKMELVETFIVTEKFKKILSPQNQIIIGSRGSGKTALLKMISHDHLSVFDNELAKEIIENKTYIGIHISTKTKFIGGLNNKDWSSDREKEYHFRWLMNIASCIAYLGTIKSCLKKYILEDDKRRELEVEISVKLSEHWFEENETYHTISEIEEKLEDIVILKSKQIVKDRIYEQKSNETIGVTFNLDLFEPLLSAIKIANRKFNFPEYTSWFICIDEIEILEEFHHKILNTYMRADMGNVFFKFTTLPYCHYTLQTNTNVALDVRHDVHYLYIDQDSMFNYKVDSTISSNLPELLFKARACLSKPAFKDVSLQQLFGESGLLNNKQINYGRIYHYTNPVLTNEQLEDVIDSEETLQLFKKYANPKTYKRGIELLRVKDITRFGNEIGRKMRGLLKLKELEASVKGNQNAITYSGAKIVVNIADANPRKLLSIYSEMLSRFEKSGEYNNFLEKRGRSSPVISFADQNFVLVSIAERELNRYRNEKNFGQSLFEFINGIGEYMHDVIHNNQLSTEQISSIEYSEDELENTWKIIERAVQKGLIYPNINVGNPDAMPYRDGVFHLAFIFAPKFKLLPRRGDSKNIYQVITAKQLKINFDA